MREASHSAPLLLPPQRRLVIAIFDLDFDAILSATYALSISAEDDYYRCVPPDPGIATAALGASESGTLPGTAPAQALHTFMLDSGTSRCFFCDSTTLTPLPAPVLVRLADPSGGPVVARSSTVLLCPAVPSGSLSGLHLPLFSTNSVSTAALQDAMVTTTTPGGQRVSICTCTRTGRHLATFTRRPGSSLYTLATEPPQVAAPAQVSASGQVAASCSCCLLSHQTLLWHHRLGHPSLPRLRGMHSRLLVSGLPRSLPPLPPLPAQPCLLCVEGRQRAVPHSSSFPPTIGPLQTLHMDDHPVLRLHSDRGGEFSSNLLRDFCHGEGILQTFTLPDSPQQNGIAEHRIGLVMEVARTSMIHTTAPIFCGRLRSGTWRISSTSGSVSPYRRPRPHCVGRGRLAMRRCSGSGVLVPLFAIRPRTSSSPVLSPASSLALSVAGSVNVCRLLSAQGVASGGAELEGAGSEGAGSGGAEPEGVEPGGSESEGAESGGAEPRGAASSGGAGGASSRLSSQQLREWLVRRARLRSGAPGVGGAGDAGAGGAGVTVGAGGLGGIAAAGSGGARTMGTGVAGIGGALALVELALEALDLEELELGALAREALELHELELLTLELESQPSLQPASPLPAPSPYTKRSGGLTEHREPASRPVSHVRTARCAPRSRPPPVPGTHAMAFRPSSIPLRVPLPAPPGSSLPAVPDPESDRTHAASPTVSCLLATAVRDPSFDSAAASALVAKLLDFDDACRLDCSSC
ncbi:unnamed protein product [Closterium sp. NIES-54]